MKSNQSLERIQADLAGAEKLLSEQGGSASASPLHPRGGTGNRADSLLYHSENNSDSGSKKNAYKPTNLQAKTFKVLDENCKHWMKIYGKEHIGILTLTFRENLKDMKESQRRWNNLSSLINRTKKFQVLVKVAEPQKRGAVHYHLIVRTYEPIRGSINWEIYEEMGKIRDTKEKRRLGKELAKSAEPHLVELWKWLRQKCKATGFGRHELMPLKKPHHIKNYIGKYLEKDMQDNTLKKGGKNHGMRMITYGKNAPKVASTQFSWLNGKSSIYRQKLRKFAEARGIKDQEEMKELFGKSWSYRMYPHIMYDTVLHEYRYSQDQALEDGDPSAGKCLYPWKGQLMSGAFSQRCKESVMEQYLQDDEKKRSSLANHSEHHRKWIRAEKAKKLHEKIYG